MQIYNDPYLLSELLKNTSNLLNVSILFFSSSIPFLITFPFSVPLRAPCFWLNDASENVVPSGAERPCFSFVPASAKSNAIDVGSGVWRASDSPDAPFKVLKMVGMFDTLESQEVLIM